MALSSQDTFDLPKGEKDLVLSANLDDNDDENLNLVDTAKTATSKAEELGDAPDPEAKNQNGSKQGEAVSEADRRSVAPSEPPPESPEDDGPSEEQRRKAWLEWLQKEPQVIGTAEYDMESFMNRSEDSKNHGRHIIEVLRIGPDHSGDIKHPIKKPKTVDDSSAVLKSTPNSTYSSSWIQRIRVQSAAIIAHLRHAGLESNASDDDLPHIFFRPFRAIAHVQPRLKQTLARLESKWGTEPQVRPGSPQAPLDTFGEADDEPFPEWLPNTAEAFKHVKHYVQFVDEQVVPLYSLFDDASITKIRFNDLSFLFKPGELVYRPAPGESTMNSPYQRHQRIWRIADVQRTLYGSPPDDINLCTSDTFDLEYYCLDYDGVNYGATFNSTQISCYTGEQEITKLAVYPVRFLTGSAKLMTDLRARGREFASFIRERHLYHDGWSIPEVPEEEPTEKQSQSHPEYIQSAVVVDYDECFKQNPQWKAKFIPIGDLSGSPEWSIPPTRIMHWTNSTRQELQLQVSDLGLRRDFSSGSMHAERIAKIHSISATIDGNFLEVQDEDCILLPGVLVVYSLRDRKFAFVNIESLKRPQKRANIFEDLKIDSKHESVIKSLVQGHFETRKVESAMGRPQISLSQDLVYGKGSGLFILLHGPPGVGKTATAEAIAQYHDKPLFSITCGDLGLTPGEVETELKGIFRIAHLWDCVLLLDEADIFLARRDIASLQRNALVSVFLRVLEYYTGILFLTTNRVGLIDEAFKSRIHLSLLYPKLDRVRTLEIFRVNIKRLRAIEEEKYKRASEAAQQSTFRRLLIDDVDILKWADSHYYYSTSNVRWNGRQIRNAFQIAASMVRYDTAATQNVEAELGKDKDDPSAPGQELVLDSKQFETVAYMTDLFEDYFKSTTGEDDEVAAQLDGYRADGWKQHKSGPAPPARNSPNPRGGAARQPSGDTRYYRDSYSKQRPPPPPPGRQPPPPQRPTRPRTGQDDGYQYRPEEQDDFYSHEEPPPRRAPKPAAPAAVPSSRQGDYPPPKELFEPTGGRDYQQAGGHRQVYHDDELYEEAYNYTEEASYETERHYF